MASNTTDNTSNCEMQDESESSNNADVAKVLEGHLKEKHLPSENRDRIVEESEEKVLKLRNSADADALSKSQKERKLENFLRQKKHSRRRRRRTHMTRSDVRAQAEKILEEFLQEQLRLQAVQTSSPEYQRYVEISVTENTTPSGYSSGFQSSSNILREDSIPYADESDNENAIRRTESLPHEEFSDIISGDNQNKPSLPIHHEKSKSAPYSQDEYIHIGARGTKRPNFIQPPPPPPPGTPHSPSENSSENLSSFPVPYTGRNDVNKSIELLGNISSLERRHSPAKKPMPASAPDSLTLSSNKPSSGSSRSFTPSSDVSHSGARSKFSDSRSNSPTKSPRLVPQSLPKSGYLTSSESDSDKHYTKGRKKKSMFKKAQERVQALLKLHNKPKSAYEDEIDTDDHSEHKPKHKKKSKKHGEKHIESSVGNVDESDIFEPGDGVKVLEDTHMQTNKHIHQSHANGDRHTVIRSTDSVEIIDSRNDKEKKHVEKHLKMKESTGHSGGFMGKLMRLTTRDKGKKSGENMKASKSSHWEAGATSGDGGNYSRAVSVPGHGHYGTDEPASSTRNHLQMYRGGTGFAFSSNERQGHDLNSQEFTSHQVVSRQEEDDKMKRNSSYLDVVDYSGNMIDRLYFDAKGKELPRNKSFDFEQKTHVHEKRVDDHGRVRVIRDVGHWDHIEMDGDNDAESRELDNNDEKDLSNLTETEKDDLYGKIANRLACIGDNFMSEKEIDRSRSVSPRSKLDDDPKAVEEEIVKTELTPLELEIRDELQRFADQMDTKLAADARTAALRLSGLVTYNHFKDVVQDSVGNGDGWAQVAAVFHITKRAVQMAGASGALAVQIKEISLKYIEDRFAGWIIGQGGWDSMLSEEESESGSDSELD